MVVKTAAGAGLHGRRFARATRARARIAPMHRRLALFAVLAACPAASLLASEAQPRPRHKVSAATLFEALSKRFPVRGGLAGLLEVQVSAPRLLLLPARNRIGAALLAQLSGAQLPGAQGGEMDVVFALRYEPTDRTLRAHRAEVLDVRWPGLPPEGMQALRSVLPSMTRQLGEIVLHQLSPAELALPDTMGFEPGEIEVADDGVVIFFRPKPPR